MSYALAAYLVGILGVAGYALYLAKERRTLLARLGAGRRSNRG